MFDQDNKQTILRFLVTNLPINEQLAEGVLLALREDAGNATLRTLSRAVCGDETAMAFLTEDAVYFLSVCQTQGVRMVRRDNSETQAVDVASRSLAFDDRWYQLVDVDGATLDQWFGTIELEFDESIWEESMPAAATTR